MVLILKKLLLPNHEISRQFWAYLVEQDKVSSPENFIKVFPMSFVWDKS
jgi:hypothetical protein